MVGEEYVCGWVDGWMDVGFAVYEGEREWRFLGRGREGDEAFGILLVMGLLWIYWVFV